jgi:hypothetical protein
MRRTSDGTGGTGMSFEVMGVGLLAGLFGAMVGLVEVGRRLAARHPPSADEAGRVGVAAVDGAVFGLMGLLLAFTFSGAISRWDTRREHIRDEVNAIGTAYLRLDLLPAAARPPLQQSFRDYVDARVATYADIQDENALQANREKAAALQGEIWRGALSACRETSAEATTLLLLPSLNETFDSATTRDLTAAAHAPAVIYITLAVVVLASALLAGHGMAGSTKVSRIHMVCYALMVTLAIYVTLEIEFPRLGFVRIDAAADAAFSELREGMK